MIRSIPTGNFFRTLMGNTYDDREYELMNRASVGLRASWKSRKQERIRARRPGIEQPETLESRTVLSGMFTGMKPIADEVIVQYASDTDVQQRAMTRHSGGFGLASQDDSTMRLDSDAGMMEVVKVPAGMTGPDAVAWLSRQPGVAYAEQNMRIESMAVSNDPYYTTNSRLWGMYGSDSPTNVGPSGTTNSYGIHAENAWNAGYTGSSSVYVGIIDTGIQIDHPDLVNNIWVNPYDPVDGIDNDGNGFVDDTNGWNFYAGSRVVYEGLDDDHGTHVAGTIGGEGGNGKGVAGVNWDVTMIPVKFLGADGGTLADAVRSINYVTDLKIRHGLNIVATNNSWGGGGYQRSLHEAILRSAKADILFVAAAGNSASNNDNTNSYPSNYSTLVGTSSVSAANYDAVVAVASITSSGSLSSFSSYGARTVDIGAPGSSINSSVPLNSYSSYSGTSMATPHVTGAFALLKSIYPNATAEQLRTAVLGSATPTASLAGKTVSGGRLNVFDAISHPALNPTPPPVPQISIGNASRLEGASGSANLVFNVTLSNAFDQAVTVNFATVDATAVAGSDYTSRTGTLTIPAGATTGTIAVSVLGDLDVESDETFLVVLSSAVNGTLADASATGTILNDDAVPTISITNASRAEGDSGTTNLRLTVSLSNPTGSPVSFRYATSDDTAVAGVDYQASSGTIVIPAGSTSAIISVPVFGDTQIENDEYFFVSIDSISSNAIPGTTTALARIDNDDFAAPELPVISIAPASVIEGDRRRATMIFTLTRTGDLSQDSYVFYYTDDTYGTADEWWDYEGKAGTVRFRPGESEKTVKIRVYGDREVEWDETFDLVLDYPENAVLAVDYAIGTIIDDDWGFYSAENVPANRELIAAPVPELDSDANFPLTRKNRKSI